MNAAPPVLRVARPTNDLEALRPFYCDGLGFEPIGHFEDHAGFDGLMLGHAHWPYHLEFTRHAAHAAPCAPSPDLLLVFYLPQRARYDAAVERMQLAGYAPVVSFNPYWDRVGVTFEDPDGYRVVLCNQEWTA